MHKIIIVDFGSQYTQLIARKVRELKVFCEIIPYYSIPELDSEVKGIILSGSPYSVRDKNSPSITVHHYANILPILGICYGAQMMVNEYGGEVIQSKVREYGRANLLKAETDSILFKNVKEGSQIWMSHGDTIFRMPPEFNLVAKTKDIPVAAFECSSQNLYGLQFHPEVYHTSEGKKVLKNFLTKVCHCKQEWTPAHYITTSIKSIQDQVGNDKVILGLSGGVDSSVAATLLHRAINKNLYCIFVDNGLLRKNEYENVISSYKKLGFNLIPVDAKARFYNALIGVTDPEQKRKQIGQTFIDVFDAEAKKIKGVKWLGQGTIYPDVIESANTNGPAATIKSHHNVGGLPLNMKLNLIEPLRLLFKDEVRIIARELNVPENIYNRHPFPGPGLAIRILGEVTEEKIFITQEADHIFIEEMKKEGLYNKVWQAGAILLPVRSVGVMGDERTYEYTIALRAVHSTDGMTADWYPLPYKFLASVSNKIINTVKSINRVVYDISSKPPATIEWE